MHGRQRYNLMRTTLLKHFRRERPIKRRGAKDGCFRANMAVPKYKPIGRVRIRLRQAAPLFLAELVFRCPAVHRRFFTLAEIDLALTVGQYKVIGVAVPIVFVVIQCKSGFLFDAEQARQLEKTAFVLMSGGFSNPDKSAAVVNEFPYGRQYIRIGSVFAAGVGGIGVADVYNNVDIL